MGTVIFTSLEKLPGSSATISEGSFAVSPHRGLLPGAYRVEITSEQPTGRKTPDRDTPGQMLDELKEAVPARYNQASELTVTVTDSEYELNFDLEASDP